MPQDTVCPCWQTGQYIWSNRCPSHLVKHPHHFSLRELQELIALAKMGKLDEKFWQRLDHFRSKRD